MQKKCNNNIFCSPRDIHHCKSNFINTVLGVVFFFFFKMDLYQTVTMSSLDSLKVVNFLFSISLEFFTRHCHKLPGITISGNVLSWEFSVIFKSCYLNTLPGVLLYVLLYIFSLK